MQYAPKPPHAPISSASPSGIPAPSCLSNNTLPANHHYADVEGRLVAALQRQRTIAANSLSLQRNMAVIVSLLTTSSDGIRDALLARLELPFAVALLLNEMPPSPETQGTKQATPTDSHRNHRNNLLLLHNNNGHCHSDEQQAHFLMQSSLLRRRISSNAAWCCSGLTEDTFALLLPLLHDMVRTYALLPDDDVEGDPMTGDRSATAHPLHRDREAMQNDATAPSCREERDFFAAVAVIRDGVCRFPQVVAAAKTQLMKALLVELENGADTLQQRAQLHITSSSHLSQHWTTCVESIDDIVARIRLSITR